MRPTSVSPRGFRGKLRTLQNAVCSDPLSTISIFDAANTEKSFRRISYSGVLRIIQNPVISVILKHKRNPCLKDIWLETIRNELSECAYYRQVMTGVFNNSYNMPAKEMGGCSASINNYQPKDHFFAFAQIASKFYVPDANLCTMRRDKLVMSDLPQFICADEQVATSR
jgi:hypothetical protein